MESSIFLILKLKPGCHLESDIFLIFKIEGLPFGMLQFLNIQIGCSLVSAELAVLPSLQGDLVKFNVVAFIFEHTFSCISTQNCLHVSVIKYFA